MLTYLAECVNSNDISKAFYGLIGLRKILCDDITSCVQPIIDLGLVRQIIGMARDSDNPYFQIEATWCITNIASGTSTQCQCLVDKGVIPVMVGILDSKYLTVVEQTIWAIANIAGDNSRNRDELLSYGIMDKLIMIVNQCEAEYLVLRSLWAIANLCRGKPAPSFKLIKQGIIVLCKVLRENRFENNVDVHVHICSAINLHCNSSDRIMFFLNEGIVPRLVDFLAEDDELVLPCLKILGSFATGNISQTQQVIDAGILPYMEMLVASDSVAIRKQVCWVLSNLVASDQ
jgi:importin subunit alpha-1